MTEKIEISPSEAAARLGMKRQWLLKLCRDDRIEDARKDGHGRWLIPVGARVKALDSGRPLTTLIIPLHPSLASKRVSFILHTPVPIRAEKP